MKLKLFTQEDCPNCPPAKNVCAELEKEGVTIEYHDTGKPDGLAESMLYEVMSTPTLVHVDDADDEIFAWRGQTPTKQDVLDKINE